MIQVFKHIEELDKAAADIFVQTAQWAVKNNGRFSVALTGGSSPVGLYKLLAQSPYREQIPWSQTYLFWGDERWVPLTNEQSNAKMAFETFINNVPVPQEQIYPMWGKETPEVFAHQYENRLRNYFGPETTPAFDLVLLGMGDDGHTASLFPNTVVLQEKGRLVYAYYLEPQQMFRITLTATCINQAKKILFLTFGAKKANALYEVLEGERNPEKYPAQLIKPTSGDVIWLVDEAAAKKLKV